MKSILISAGLAALLIAAPRARAQQPQQLPPWMRPTQTPAPGGAAPRATGASTLSLIHI
mgnify:CR=1 FL=1